MSILRDGIFDAIYNMIKGAKESILISSAWVDGRILGRIFEDVDLEKIQDKRVIIRASERKDMEIDGALSISLLKEKGFKIAFHPNLRAKFMVINGESGIVGSSNFTTRGLTGGNAEVDVVLNKSRAAALKNTFESSWKEAFKVEEDIVGITMNPGKSKSVGFLVLNREKVKENSFLIVKIDEEKGALLRTMTIMSYDTSFFMNPFTTTEGEKFPRFNELEFIHQDDSPLWKVASSYSFINGYSGNEILVATASVEGFFPLNSDIATLNMPDVPIPAKLWVYEIPEKFMERFYSGERAVKIGKYYGTKSDAFIDIDKINTTHMSIFGTTGSGKSYFTKLLIKRTVETTDDITIYILDPHGEYARELKDSLGEELVDVAEFEGEPVVLTSKDDLVNFLKEFGIDVGNAYNSVVLQYFIKNYGLYETLKRIVIDKVEEGDSKLFLKLKKDVPEDKAAELLDSFKEKTLNDINTIKTLLEKTEKGEKRIVIFNLKKVETPQSRVNIAGYIGEYLFKKAKEDMKRRIVVLEEAHNFVPEGKVGDVTSGKSNPAFRIFTKIASEGRKFNLGLVTITQRPANVTKYLISQSNTFMIFRLVNDQDLKAVSDTVESASKGIISMLPSLTVGKAFVTGLATPISSLVEVE